MVPSIRQANVVQQRQCPLTLGAQRLAVEQFGEGDVLPRGQARQEQERLEHEAELSAPELCALIIGEVRGVDAVDAQRAGGGVVDEPEKV